MVARLNRVPNDEQDSETVPHPDCPPVDYHRTRSVPDEFPDPSLLDPVDDTQEPEIRQAVTDMLNRAKEKELPASDCARLTVTVNNHFNVFRVSFSAGPPAKVRRLRIRPTADAKPVIILLRKYSH